MVEKGEHALIYANAGNGCTVHTRERVGNYRTMPGACWEGGDIRRHFSAIVAAGASVKGGASIRICSTVAVSCAARKRPALQGYLSANSCTLLQAL